MSLPPILRPSPNENKALAYLLYNKYRWTQKDIASHFKKSQGAISMWIKEASYLIQTNQLKTEIENADRKILNKDF